MRFPSPAASFYVYRVEFRNLRRYTYPGAVLSTCSREPPKGKTGGYVPSEPIKRGLVPGAKSADRQKRGFVPAHDFANRRENELVKSFSRAKLYRREIWEDIRFVVGHVYEDNVPTYKAFSASQNNYVLNRALYLHRERPGSITATVSQSNLADQLLSFSQVFAFVQDNTPRLFTPQQLMRARQSQLNGMMGGYSRYCSKYGEDAFAKEARQKIIESGKEIEIENVGLRTRIAWHMLCSCPWLLRMLYPAYRIVRQGIRKLTGR